MERHSIDPRSSYGILDCRFSAKFILVDVRLRRAVGSAVLWDFVLDFPIRSVGREQRISTLRAWKKVRELRGSLLISSTYVNVYGRQAGP